MKMIFVFVCCLFINKSFCQKDVKLNGTLTKFKSGNILLIPLINDARYYTDFSIYESSVINGNFSFVRKVYDSFPRAYYIEYTNDSLRLETGMLMIEPKDQSVLIDSFDIYISPKILNSPFQEELIFDYGSFFTPIINRSNLFFNEFDRINRKYNKNPPSDSLLKMYYTKDTIRREADSLFSIYVERHKMSYISIWKLIDRIKLFGYKPRYEKDFKNLDKSIMESRIGESLLGEMKQIKALSAGNIFPELNIQTLLKKSSTFNIKSYAGKLVLVEFWFHNCGPCIAQFTSLENIYNKYKRENFEIVAISIDKSKDLLKLKNTLTQKNYPWLNIWDENALNAENYLIKSFPTNFLINEKGEIIDVNVPPFLVENYIREKLYKKTYFSSNFEPE